MEDPVQIPRGLKKYYRKNIFTNVKNKKVLNDLPCFFQTPKKKNKTQNTFAIQSKRSYLPPYFRLRRKNHKKIFSLILYMTTKHCFLCLFVAPPDPPLILCVFEL
jgi:hypothetical protein